jgi:hypothetical protein
VNVLEVLAVWCVLSVVVGLIAGRALWVGMGRNE